MADQTPILPTCTTPKRTSAGATMGRNSSADPNADSSPSLRAASFAASRSRKISASGYFFTLAFLACVVVLVSNVSGLSAHNMFRTTTSYSEMYRTQFSSVVSRFFPGSGYLMMPNATVENPPPEVNVNGTSHGMRMVEDEERNGESYDQNTGRKAIASSGSLKSLPPVIPPPTPVKLDEIEKLESSDRTGGRRPRRGRGEKKGRKRKPKAAKRKENLHKEMKQCDLFDGSWVKDESYPLYEAGSCPHLDESFNCYGNGRPDREYEKYRWQPKNCNVPRLSGKVMLQMMKGKRFVFVGDSLNRNMWESLVCILRNSVPDKNKVYEVSGREEFRSDGSYSFVFEDYNCSVEFYRSTFLVQEWEMPDADGKKKETLRLDLVERSSDRYKSADFLVFNTGHWWTHEKTSEGKGYYQEGSHVYDHLDVNEAFGRAMTTWARWVDTNINPWRTTVVFRSYSASHFIGGEWNSGGQCDAEAEPIKNDNQLSEYPPTPLVHVLERTLKRMKTPVFYQDCSHWCLPGVPDTWNELIYAELLTRQRWRHRGGTQGRVEARRSLNKTVHESVQVISSNFSN